MPTVHVGSTCARAPAAGVPSGRTEGCDHACWRLAHPVRQETRGCSPTSRCTATPASATPSPCRGSGSSATCSARRGASSPSAKGGVEERRGAPSRSRSSRSHGRATVSRASAPALQRLVGEHPRVLAEERGEPPAAAAEAVLPLGAGAVASRAGRAGEGDRHGGRRVRAVAERNWAGNYTYRASALHRPATLDELREIVARRAAAAGARLAPLVQRHRRLDELVSLDGLPRDIVVDAPPARSPAAPDYATASWPRRSPPRASRCTTSPRCRTSRSRARSPPRRTARATATATSPPRSPALELVTSDGERRRRAARRRRLRRPRRRARRARRRHPRDARRRARLRGPPARLRGPLLGRAVRALRRDHARRLQRQRLHRWGEAVRPGVGQDPRHATRRRSRPSCSARRAATVERHPILGIDPVNCTPQLGAPGPGTTGCRTSAWASRRATATSSSREYLVARAHAVAAIEAVRALGDRVRPLLQVCEIRTIAADRLWMSPQYERDTVAHPLHLEPRAGARRARARRASRRRWRRSTRARTGARSSWPTRRRSRRCYPRLADFGALVERLDPRGAFRNAWLDTACSAPR